MKLYTCSEVAKLLGVEAQAISYHQRVGHLPRGSVKVGKRTCYTEADIDRLRDFFGLTPAQKRSAASLYSIVQAARVLGVGDALLTYRIDRGQLPRPQIKKGARWYYDDAGLAELRQQIEASPPNSARSNPFEHEGYLNVKQAADWMGMPSITLQTWLDKERVPQPTHDIGGVSYWTRDEVRAIRKANRDYFLKRLKLL